jgi:hypothetical protein
MHVIKFWNGDKIEAETPDQAKAEILAKFPNAFISDRPFRTVAWACKYDRLGDEQGRYAVAEIEAMR